MTRQAHNLGATGSQKAVGLTQVGKPGPPPTDLLLLHNELQRILTRARRERELCSHQAYCLLLCLPSVQNTLSCL